MIEFSVTIAVFLSLAGTCFTISAFFLWQEIGEVNRKRSPEEQISYWGMYPGKMAKIRAEYERLYPSGKIDLLRRVFQAAGIAFMALLLIPLGAFR